MISERKKVRIRKRKKRKKKKEKRKRKKYGILEDEMSFRTESDGIPQYGSISLFPKRSDTISPTLFEASVNHNVFPLSLKTNWGG